MVEDILHLNPLFWKKQYNQKVLEENFLRLDKKSLTFILSSVEPSKENFQERYDLFLINTFKDYTLCSAFSRTIRVRGKAYLDSQNFLKVD
jgi:hypothetical protein